MNKPDGAPPVAPKIRLSLELTKTGPFVTFDAFLTDDAANIVHVGHKRAVRAGSIHSPQEADAHWAAVVDEIKREIAGREATAPLYLLLPAFLNNTTAFPVNAELTPELTPNSAPPPEVPT